MKPHLFKVSSTQWACSPSKDDKHLMRCRFGDEPSEAFNNFTSIGPMSIVGYSVLWNAQGTEIARGFQ